MALQRLLGACALRRMHAAASVCNFTTQCRNSHRFGQSTQSISYNNTNTCRGGMHTYHLQARAKSSFSQKLAKKLKMPGGKKQGLKKMPVGPPPKKVKEAKFIKSIPMPKATAEKLSTHKEGIPKSSSKFIQPIPVSQATAEALSTNKATAKPESKLGADEWKTSQERTDHISQTEKRVAIAALVSLVIGFVFIKLTVFDVRNAIPSPPLDGFPTVPANAAVVVNDDDDLTTVTANVDVNVDVIENDDGGGLTNRRWFNDSSDGNDQR